MDSSVPVLLIDAHALCYRAFYAVKDLRNSRGQPTNAVFGFVNILKKIIARYKPGYIAACFDVGGQTKRAARFADYKIHRPSMPEDLAAQIPVIKDVLTAFNISVFGMEGYEADDLIAVLARRFSAGGQEVIIVSDDKDLHQLLGNGVRIYNSRRDCLLGPDDTLERYGVTPAQMVDYLALAGDTSDNIPGVPGIGEVTAQKLIQQYGSLENIFARSDELKGKLKEKIIDGRGSALLSRELATLDADTPLECTLQGIQWKGGDNARLKQIFSDLEFRVLLEGLPRKDEAPVQSEASLPPSEALVPVDMPVLFKEALRLGRCALVLNDDQAVVAAGNMAAQCLILNLALLGEILSSDAIVKVVYDAKAVRKFLAGYSIECKDPVFDVLLAGFLTNAGRSAYTVGALSWSFLKRSLDDGSGVFEEAGTLRDLYAPLCASLNAGGLRGLYDNVEAPLSAVLGRMEAEGVALDVRLLEQLSLESAKKINAITVRLQAMAGEEFNCNSPKQLGVILFEKLKLPVIKKTKTGYSTDEEVLLRLADQHELPALVLEYRQLSKLKTTYIDALPKMAASDTGRIHCSFNQAGAETGRLSSSHPNLQNIPVRTEEGRMIRRAFTASARDRVLVSADYSQIELRVLAHLADEPNLRQAFLNGEDIHRYTAGLMFDVAAGDVTPEMRYSAKRINFGIIYGMSAYGLAKDLGVGQKEAQGFIERYFMRYPGIQSFMDREIAKARECGYSATMFARRRYLPDINSRNAGARQFAERQAINTPVQGTAADIIKIAMIHMSDAIHHRGFEGRMIITVHDELVFDVPRRELNDFGAMVKQVMEGAVKLSVPVEATVKYGPNWAEMAGL
jgi:DNA polymerase-1